jgi:SAM-dependent methyltransferase
MCAPPGTVYARGLERPDPAYRLRLASGELRAVPFERWLGGVTDADTQVLAHTVGPVLDVGCGPGRHVRELACRGVLALGVDASTAAVRLARSRGVSVFEGSVFDAIPGAGEWRSALLLDGNLGIGGRPERLLHRVGALLIRGGIILAEVDPPGAPTGRVYARLEGPDLMSRWFAWATVGVDGMHAIAEAAGMTLRERFEHDGRWFVVVES